MNNTVVVIDVAFGDAGKGRIVDYLSKTAEVVVRFAGGPNAGHTLQINNDKTILRLIPSGILHPHTLCVMGHGMVIDPIVFYNEIVALEEKSISLDERLLLSNHAHVILPEHIELDIAKNANLGTTKKGIGPCYEAKVARTGKRIIDLMNDSMGFDHDVIKMIRRFATKNISQILNVNIKMGRKVIFEGAQGTFLDIDCGTYPFVTSSNAIAGGACTATGVGPTAITLALGVSKAYITRVGEGPFPTELFDKNAEYIQTTGKEFGSVTQRPRRVGWLDLPLLRYAKDVNDLGMLAITKLDILSGLKEIKIATHYMLDGEEIKYPDLDKLNNVVPVYKTFSGWDEDISEVTEFDKLPVNAQKYITYIADELELPISIVTVGPDREQTINCFDDAFDLYYSSRYGFIQDIAEKAVDNYFRSLK